MTRSAHEESMSRIAIREVNKAPVTFKSRNVILDELSKTTRGLAAVGHTVCFPLVCSFAMFALGRRVQATHGYTKGEQLLCRTRCLKTLEQLALGEVARRACLQAVRKGPPHRTER